MRLLFDQNLSPKLVQALADLFEGSLHLENVGLAAADDKQVWDYAAAHDLVIVTKDDDFRQRSFLFGFPPKVLWIRLGNCSTAVIEAAIRSRHSEILEFYTNTTASLMMIASVVGAE